MTATAETPLRNRDRGRGVAHPTSFLRILRAETLKFFTIPSPVILLLCSVLLMAGIAALSAWGLGSFSAMAADDPEMAAGAPDLSATSTLFGGVSFAQLIVGSLGVIIGSSEFTTGMARTTFTAVPRRLTVLGAKAVVLSVAAAVVALVGAVLSALVVWPIAENYSMVFEPFGASAQQQLWTSVAYLAAVALIGLALGVLLRNAAGGIVILAALLFVLPIVFAMIGIDVLSTVATYLPDAAYTVISGTSVDPAQAEMMNMAEPLGLWQAWTALSAWAVLPLVAAGAVLHRRDI